jgi:hypothetical protein
MTPAKQYMKSIPVMILERKPFFRTCDAASQNKNKSQNEWNFWFHGKSITGIL